MELKHFVCECDACHFNEVDRVWGAFLDEQLTTDELRAAMARLRDRRIRRKEKEKNL